MKLYHWLMGILFPPRCILCRKVLKKEELDLCRSCRSDTPDYCGGKRKLQFLDSFCAIWYYRENVRSSLLRYKFGYARYYAQGYGRLLAMKLLQEYPDGFHDLEYAKPIRIGDGSWICSSATICGGVTIGKNCIVAAGAVVNRDIPDNCIVAGVPARVLRKLDEQDRMNVWDTYMKNEVPLSQRKRER